MQEVLTKEHNIDKRAYSELYAILQMLGKEYIDKIPEKIYNAIESRKDDTYNPIYNDMEEVLEGRVKRKTVSMLALLDYNYFSTTETDRMYMRYILEENENKYKKNKNEYKLPGGGVDKGEDFKEAFKRECIEEIGCMIENVEYLFDIEEDHINDNFKQISKVYIAKVKEKLESNNLTEQEKEEGLEYLWLDKKEALEKMKLCIENLKGSKYDNVYRTKFVVGRDIRIMEKVMEDV